MLDLPQAASTLRQALATASEVWTFEMPALALRARRPLPVPLPAQEIVRDGLAAPWSLVALEPSGRCAFAHAVIPFGRGEEVPPSLAVYFSGTAPQICRAASPSGSPVLSGGWLAVPAGPELLLFDEAARALVTRVGLERGRWTSVRIDGTALVAADDCGRVLLVDLEKGQVVRELRV